MPIADQIKEMSAIRRFYSPCCRSQRNSGALVVDQTLLLNTVPLDYHPESRQVFNHANGFRSNKVRDRLWRVVRQLSMSARTDSPRMKITCFGSGFELEASRARDESAPATESDRMKLRRFMVIEPYLESLPMCPNSFCEFVLAASSDLKRPLAISA